MNARSTKITVTSERLDRPPPRRQIPIDDLYMREGDEIMTRDVAWPPDADEIEQKRVQVAAEAQARGKRIRPLREPLDTEYNNGRGTARWLVERIPTP